MILYFIYTHDLIQKAVKLETSLLADRRKKEVAKGQVEDMLNELVMDEDYEVMFKRLFNAAHAEIMLNIPKSYLVDTPTDISPMYAEFPDFSQDRDFILYLNMQDDFPKQYTKSIDAKIEEFIIDYICYRWLETKSPNDAKTYFSRLPKTTSDISRLIVRKDRPLRRYPSFP